ncbi:MAG: hypothetical protein C4B59_00535 [Candidatus Methanogaster sp.]|uniref:Uncharacterized protein n=1 Tax=Candidatus Methanogaster sp. TaxID=3386292 RepID=A0AC61L6Y8_9EURY|nr:MAG: hypothetical protein C4B59_00535 [ANME-2 cluster archaeon]
MGREWGNLSCTSPGDMLQIGTNNISISNDAKIESVNIMENVQQLTRCPKCGKRLHVCGHIQICSICGILITLICLGF